MELKPLITFGITAFKEGNLLKEAIDSVINQKNELWECILVLDGGADNITSKIFNDFNHHKFKKYKFLDNQGPYRTRTKAIELASTEWYAHLDGDDLLHPNAVKNIIGILLFFLIIF